ncbi:MAG: (2Fe-2S) ferredoxin domain-containing protein [Patescibacteria group bacterium]|jgi:NADH:ubiquinone oxidoreductase subunit E
MKKVNIKVCCGNKCSERGAVRILEELQDKFDESSVEISKCLDYCERAPTVIADDKIYFECRTKDIAERIKKDSGLPITEIKIEDLHLDDDLI